jgi:hypothetical protein
MTIFPVFNCKNEKVSGQTGYPLAGGRARMKLQLEAYVRPSKSRLKTAPTIYNSVMYQCSFFFDLIGCTRLDYILTPDT